MKKNLILATLLLFMGINAQSQNLNKPSFNLDFEKNIINAAMPDEWIKWGSTDFNVHKDSIHAYKGKFSTVIYRKSDAFAQSFGSVAYRLPANYQGKTIRLEGYMKIEEVADGFAGILMRIDGQDGSVVEFKSLEDKAIMGTHDWKKYTITLPFHEDAKSVYITGILKGQGKAWFDNFEVFIDDKNIKELKQIEREVKISKAQLDKEFDNGSNIQIKNLTEKQTQNLYKLGKIWGFVKYYHPEVAKGLHNWDYELFRVLPKVLDATSDEQAEANILNWLQTVFTTKLTDKTLSRDSKNLKLAAKTDWLKDKTLINSDLSRMLEVFENIVKPQAHHYIAFMPSVGNPIFQNENEYKNLKYTDDGVKLLALFRYWNMIEYFFPNRHLMDDNWDKVLKTFIPKMIESDDELSYKLVILELIGKIQDTHANIWQNHKVLTTFWGENTAPIEVKMIENKVVVTRLLGDSTNALKIEIGDVITDINGEKVEQLIEQKIKYCPASNRPTQLRDMMKKLLKTNETNLDLTIEGKGTQKVQCSIIKSSSFRDTTSPSHKLLADNIGYIYPGTLKGGEINDIMKKFKDTKGLIIDMRCYPSEFIVFSLGQYLMPQPTEFVKFAKGSLEKSGDFEYRPPLKVGNKNNDYYKGKIAILINETTQSQAEYTTMAFRVAPKVTVIGSTTAGADGNVSNIILPGNIRTMISGIGIYYPDGRETQRIGIIPDIEMHPTIKGVKNKVDELLNKAIEMVK